ncbi:hypothetical protein BDQ12DRAFT_716174 [Crucibulum laeve]|uniref:Uncharacterized protein n=1 Tax=Crucibulum laeve TaxID=68775 RepID=A0A5C3LJ63_9AGAR|nr:hypothetical protein BDQ12DRAFT_716174 [Crucibulum laeve]
MASISFPDCQTLPAFQRANNRRGWLLGTIFSTLGYGIVFTLFMLCIALLRDRVAQPRSRLQNTVLRAYVSIMFVTSTVATILVIYATTGALIDRTCPSSDQIPVNPYFGKVDIVYTFLNWCSDSLLIWRCMVIFSTSHISPWAYLGIPLAFLVASFGTGMALVVLSGFGRTKTVNLMLITYGLVTLVTNTLITSMIITRLVMHRRHVAKVLGRASQYTDIITILIESALLVVVIDIFFLVAFSLNSWYGAIAFQMWIQVQSIAPLLIIFRVAQGKAWSRSTGDMMTASQPLVLISQEIDVHKVQDHGCS